MVFPFFPVKADVERDAIHIRVRTAFRSLEAIEYSRDKPNVSSSYSPTLAPSWTFKEIVRNEWNGRRWKSNYRPKVMKCWPSDNHRSKNQWRSSVITGTLSTGKLFPILKRNSLTSRERRVQRFHPSCRRDSIQMNENRTELDSMPINRHLTYGFHLANDQPLNSSGNECFGYLVVVLLGQWDA